MYKSGLVLEGGGTRGIYTSGVLDAFLDNGIEFPYVVGVSAGSCNAVSYIAKCRGRQHDITIQYVNDKRYMGVESAIKNGEFLNSNWIFGELSYDLSPLDQEAFENSGAVFCSVATNALTGKAEYFYPKSLRERGCPEIKASCALPVFTKPTKIGKDYYYDGGIMDSIPLEHCFEDGCQKAVVILTQHKGFVKKPMSPKIAKAMKKYPKVAEGIINRHNMYNQQLEYVEQMEKEGLAYAIRPVLPLDCKTLEKNTAKLESIYQLGYRQGVKIADDVKKFISE